MQELELLNAKLDTLLKKYKALQAENRSLKETMSQQLKSVTILNETLASIEDTMVTNSMNKAMADTSNKDVLRKQLDSVIGEIDKILTSLND